jgi:ubiquinone/menaquinone biosynthesis C-methylase UbiE
MSDAGTALKSGGSGLNAADFQRIGVGGVGDPRNSYCHSMDFFEGSLYVGTTRDTLCILKRPGRAAPPPHFDQWPVLCAVPENQEFMRAQILRYHPGRKEWEKVHDSPYYDFEDGHRIARDIGYRGMAVYQGTTDPKPCIYIGSHSATGCRILRSEDGFHFHDPTGPLPQEATSVRTICEFKGRLYTSALGITKRDANESRQVEILESVDPHGKGWRVVSSPSFGDPSNVSIFDLAVFNDHLYVSTMNPKSGFQIWKSRCEGSAPYEWTKVMTAGAYRGFLNEFAIALCPFGDALYIGTGIAGCGYDRFNKIGPAAAELLRIYPDDSWDLLVGAARITPQGFKAPLSGMGPGFDSFMNGYMWRMIEHDGWLYVGTANYGVFTRFNPHRLSPMPPEEQEAIGRLLPTESIAAYIEKFSGCHLWRTRDGQRFYPVTRNGFGNPYNLGIRRFASTPEGLFLGTVNPFGPQVAVKRDNEWTYEENPRGGIEIYHGVSPTSPQRPKQLQTPLSRDAQIRHAPWLLKQRLEYFGLWVYLEKIFGNSAFHQYGLWEPDTPTAAEAGHRLVEEAVSLLPHRNGVILDLGCGRGGTTSALTRHFAPEQIIGIDEWLFPLDYGMARDERLRFMDMNPARMELEDASADVIFCFAGTAAFDNRRAFFPDACRVLKPGGSLIIAETLFSRAHLHATGGKFRTNHIASPAQYRQQLERAGFSIQRVDDIIDRSLYAFCRHASQLLGRLYREQAMTESEFSNAMKLVARPLLLTQSQFLVHAVKTSR